MKTGPELNNRVIDMYTEFCLKQLTWIIKKGLVNDLDFITTNDVYLPILMLLNT